MHQITALGGKSYEVRFASPRTSSEIVAVWEIDEGDIPLVHSSGVFDDPANVWAGDAASVRAVFAAVVAFHEARQAGFMAI